jgi:DegV family protein with EDD domain
MAPPAPIEILDSELTSMGMGYPVLLAARAAEQGATLKECKTLAEQACRNSGIIFAVNTLEFLHRGGRIGGAAAFLGTALNLKPLLELRNGRIEAVERIRTMSKATERLLDLIEQRVGSRTPIRLAAVHASGRELAETLLEKARTRFSITSISQTSIADVSPVIGVHTGPGCVGLTFTAGM